MKGKALCSKKKWSDLRGGLNCENEDQCLYTIFFLDLSLPICKGGTYKKRIHMFTVLYDAHENVHI